MVVSRNLYKFRYSPLSQVYLTYMLFLELVILPKRRVYGIYGAMCDCERNICIMIELLLGKTQEMR